MSMFAGATILLLKACSPPANTAKEVCEDFLEKWEAKPAELEFTHCKRVENPQFDRLESSYVVAGADAASVEQFLQREFNLAPLRFVCCVWESTTGDANRPSHASYTDEEGYYFHISMGSEETLLRDRKDWPNISQFHVRVTKHLGSP
ncbi:DUF4952 domain-containing protein [Leptothoe sp. PORK10 BA2]|uniref:DUF4952 domain-containing protein n=1 Tax=Leptothoe sp. PORK10 BA2 TaxID=3110254 RepID=UPI002B1F3BD3|nr:DUF4952 domain-containing protein [Leptothoe sp. PORK10 BA2]MEA5466495.1 DUF4952 domain-containing protein [Leptothoe sp. PORK10 BA2]